MENEQIVETLNTIDDMASAGLPMVGFFNFLFADNTSINIDEVGKTYLDILKKYNCCGFGNRPHYMKVRVPGETMVLRRFFDGVSGRPFYANRFYGVITFDFSSYKDDVPVIVMDCLKEYLNSNKDNIKFVISNVPTKGMRRIANWDEFNFVHGATDRINAKEYLNKTIKEINVMYTESSLAYIEKVLSNYPKDVWKEVINFFLSMEPQKLKKLTDMDEDYELEETKIGFNV